MLQQQQQQQEGFIKFCDTDSISHKEYVVLRTNIHPKSGRCHQKVDVPSLATNYTVV